MSQVINTRLSKAITSGDYFHHLVYSISGTTHTLFLDNSEIAVNINGGNIFSTYPNIKKLFLGIAGDLSYGFTGYIDDFKVYNRALTTTEVSAIYNLNTKIISLYSPSSPIAGLTLWLDAATSTSFSTTDGITWQDKSGLGNHMTTTNTTTGYNLITSTLNNKPTIYFPKSGICLRNTNILNESFPITYFFVYAMGTTTSGNENNCIMCANYYPDDVNYAGGTNGQIQSTPLDITSFYIGGTAGIPLSNTITTPNTSSSFCMITIQIDGSGNVSSKLIVNVNGTNQVTRTGYVGTFNTSCKGVIIRPSKQDMYISEILYYKSALSQSDIQEIEGYLAWKWGINTLLPIAHPYYLLAPPPPPAPTITSITPMSNENVLLYFTQPTAKKVTNYYYSINDGYTYTACSPIQITSPLNISGLTTGTNYTFSIYAVNYAGNGGISNYISLSPFTDISNIPFTTNKTILTSTITNATINWLSVTDYGKMLIATSNGIYYSYDFGNTFQNVQPATGTDPSNCSCVSLNNKGYALCCTSSAIYFSYNYGIIWSKANASSILKIPTHVFVTQTGLTYVLNKTSTTTYYYSSSDYFNTYNLMSIAGLGALAMFGINFASDGTAVIITQSYKIYYNGSTSVNFTTPSNMYGGGISDNGKYLALLSSSITNAASFGTISNKTIPTLTPKSGGGNGAAGQTYNGNNGIVYHRKESTTLVYKYNFINNTYVSTTINTVATTNNWGATSPSGNYAVVRTSTSLILLPP